MQGHRSQLFSPLMNGLNSEKQKYGSVLDSPAKQHSKFVPIPPILARLAVQFSRQVQNGSQNVIFSFPGIRQIITVEKRSDQFSRILVISYFGFSWCYYIVSVPQQQRCSHSQICRMTTFCRCTV